MCKQRNRGDDATAITFAKYALADLLDRCVDEY